MSARATWKGFLRLGDVVCAVALYTAASSSERVRLHMVNRRTGHRLSRHFVDSETGDEVERDDQVKGYEVADGEHVVFEPDEIAAAMPKGDKTLTIDSFLACDEVDDLYFDRPYYLRPADEASEAGFAVIREGLRQRKVVAIASAMLFRRPRSLLIRAYDEGLVATTLNYDYEVRSAAEAFEDVSKVKIEPEMLDLARHIIETKAGRFQPETFEDRYDDALAELVRAKLAGRKITPPRRVAAKPVSLMDALRESAGLGSSSGRKASTGRKASSGHKAASTSKAGKAAAAASKASSSKAPSSKSSSAKSAKGHSRPAARKAG